MNKLSLALVLACALLAMTPNWKGALASGSGYALDGNYKGSQVTESQQVK